MSAGESISAPVLKRAMLAAGDQISERRADLSALDAAAGDGDLGATLAPGFAHVRDALESLDDPDVGALLKQSGVTLARKAPSTIGALLGSAFMRAGTEFEGVDALSAPDVAGLMSALLDAVSERGGAVPGDRTVVDALDGAASAARQELVTGADAVDVLVAAANGAAAAAERTADMEAKFGRAAWVSERARGHRDAGAVAWAVYIGALANSVARSRAGSCVMPAHDDRSPTASGPNRKEER